MKFFLHSLARICTGIAILAIVMITGCSPSTPVETGDKKTAPKEASRDAPREAVGFVIEMSGNWMVDGDPGKILAVGDELVEGVQVRLEKGSAESRIVVFYFSGKAETNLTTFTPKSQTDLRLSTKLAKAIGSRYRGRVINAVSRGGEMLGCAVLKLDGQSLEMGPALLDTPPGTWHFRLSQWDRAKSDDAKEQIEPLHFSVAWSGEGPATTDVKGCTPGLYELGVVNQRTGRLVSDPVLVLICGTESFSSISDSFADAQKVSKSWDETTQNIAADDWLRAALEALATDSIE